MSVIGVPRFGGGVEQNEGSRVRKEPFQDNCSERPLGRTWPERIRAIWARGGANTLELARTVRSARAELKRGEWCALWVSDAMPFSRRKAQMLLVIADGLDWANVNTCSHLPQGWRILYCLARLKREHLDHLIAEGVVHPRLKLAEAKELIQHLAGQSPFASNSRPKVLDRLNRLSQFVAATLEDWSPEQCALAKETLLEIATSIEAGPTQQHTHKSSEQLA
jgi:hypothetical protein